MATATKREPSTSTRAERDRLRDYYGLGSSDNGSGSSSFSPRPTSDAPRPPQADVSAAPKYKQLIKDESISGLLKAQSDLLTEIRELDGDRQSLVYNHHTDLVEASETIRKMKAHSDSLSPTLEALSTSFQSMSRLSDQLKGALQPALSPASTASSGSLDINRDLVPIVTLPRRLKDVIALSREDSGEKQGLPAAEALWGRHEAILSTWTQAGVPGAADIAAECRAVLKEERERIKGGGGGL